MTRTDELIRILEVGNFVTGEEMQEVADILKRYRKDAQRYRWLNKYTSQVFMVTEQQLNEQVDRAMRGKE